MVSNTSIVVLACRVPFMSFLWVNYLVFRWTLLGKAYAYKHIKDGETKAENEYKT